MKHVGLFATFAGACVLVHAVSAQEATGGRIQLQVFDSNVGAWSSTTSALPGSRVEWRVVVSYTGTNTNVYAMGGLRYQVTFSNADNTGASLDELAPWRNGGEQGNAIAGSMLSAAEGADGGPLASYGRVRFGATAMNSASQNTITTWRHGGDTPRPVTPPGSWLRIAGSGESIWPQRPFPYDEPTPLFLSRGLSANQQSAVNPVTGGINTLHIAGTQGLVVFRGALLLSDEVARSGDITLDIPLASLMGGPPITPPVIPVPPEPYYMTWQTSATDGGGWRAGMVVESAVITIPSAGTLLPMVAMMLGLASRRRRDCANTVG